MKMNINTNIPALKSNNELNKTNALLSKHFAKLSSGKKITRASDGAAELAISEKLSAQLRALNQATRNTMDGVSMIQTADRATNEIGSNLSRMRELALQAANGTLSDDDRAAINEEFSALRDEIDRTAATTQFNGQNLLDGSADVTLQVGTGSGNQEQTNIQIGSLQAASLGDGTNTLSELSVGQAANATAALEVLDGAMNQVSSLRADLGAKQNTLVSTMNNLQVEHENIAAANSRIADVDVAKESMELARDQILQQAQLSITSQANQLPAMALSLIG